MKTLLVLLVIFSNILYANTKGLKCSIVYAENKKVLEYTASHALLIGVSDYKHWRDLPTVKKEIDKIYQTLSDNGFKVEKVINPDADELEEAYEEFIEKYGYDENNRLLFYYSGHGYTDNSLGYLVPSDAQTQKDKRSLKRKALSMSRIKTYAEEMQSKHALFLFDSCFSGSIFTTKGSNELPEYIKKDVQNPVRYFITAGDETQETPANSVFANCFIEAIAEQKGDMNNDGYITGRELGSYLYQQVSQRTKDTLQNSPQHGPINISRLRKGDFVFFTSKSGDKQNEVSEIELLKAKLARLERERKIRYDRVNEFSIFINETLQYKDLENMAQDKQKSLFEFLSNSLGKNPNQKALQFNIAILYYFGIGVDKDYSKPQVNPI